MNQTQRTSRLQTLAKIMPLLALGGLTGCQAIDVLSGNTAVRAVQRMEDPHFADERREGILYLVQRDFGRHDPYTQRYIEIAEGDEDYTVRAIAIRALNRSRLQAATPTFIAALDDPAPLVRLEAAKALVNLPDPNAIGPLLETVSDEREDRDVRIAAADALRHYKTINVARILANLLSSRDFSIAWQCRQSLRRMTGTDHRYDPGAWLQYMTSPGSPFQ